MDGEESGGSDESTLAYQFVPPKKKSATQIYRAFKKLAVESMGKNNLKSTLTLIEEFKAQRLSVREFSTKMEGLFANDPALVIMFYDQLLPSLKPELSKHDEELFLNTIKREFRYDQGRYALVHLSVVRYRVGTISLSTMTEQLANLLKHNETAKEAFTNYLPESLPLLDELMHEESSRKICILVIAYVALTAFTLALAAYLAK